MVKLLATIFTVLSSLLIHFFSKSYLARKEAQQKENQKAGNLQAQAEATRIAEAEVNNVQGEMAATARDVDAVRAARSLRDGSKTAQSAIDRANGKLR